jgi:xanthine dehydrogenase iron-sulfur cluster and FAD-binding subunit A
MWHEYVAASQVDEVLNVLAERREQARIIAGATDLILEIERKVRKGIRTLVDVSRIGGLDQITIDEDQRIHLGALVTHNHCVASKLIVERAYPLARAAWEVGSPQIRNRGTVAGNLITASPANDTITPLMALGASVVLSSKRGDRIVALKDFYTGVRRTVMQPDEMLVDIFFPAFKPTQRGTFIKFALRQAQAISLVNVAIVLDIQDQIVQSAAITLGAVAPTIIHAARAEEFLNGKKLDDAVVEKAAELVAGDARPIDDIRSSGGYRKEIVKVIARRGIEAIVSGKEKIGFPANPVRLWGKENYQVEPLTKSEYFDLKSPIVTRINGKEYTFKSGQNKTLLRFLREEAGLIGTKEGCAEGECGACTVFLDGIAVMSCMVPAPRANGAEIVTVEGLAKDGMLHPIQQAFIDEGAVQCGYCTPGFLMSSAKLLEERTNPTGDEIRQALTGNLCRCTGYYKIIKAVEKAAMENT